MRRSWIGLVALGVVSTLGCLTEYHPEVHPVTSYRYTQNLTYPTVVVRERGVSASSTDGAAVDAGANPKLAVRPIAVGPEAADSAAGRRPDPIPCQPGPLFATTATTTAASSPPHRPVDDAVLAGCLDGDDGACRALARAHLRSSDAEHLTGLLISRSDVTGAPGTATDRSRVNGGLPLRSIHRPRGGR